MITCWKVSSGIARAVNDSCSLKFLFWGHFPPEKHKIAHKIIEEVNDYRLLFKISCFCFFWEIFVCLPLCAADHGLFLPPLLLGRQKKNVLTGKNSCYLLLMVKKILTPAIFWSGKNVLYGKNSCCSPELSPGWENRTDKFFQQLVHCSWHWTRTESLELSQS